ncbi:MAG: methyltransferase [Pseudomonadales bacterium]|nr:methyltransferase [Pseudomonadales bacterium]NIX09423.1 methyltransferase [Pseudomonadales bacterium]
MPRAFDKAYYDRYYRNARTRVTSPAAIRRQAAFLAAYLNYLELRPRSIVDVGCGTGTLLRALGKHFPRARLAGVEVSDYLCRHHGWLKGSVVDFHAEEEFDLVVCNDVLAYLDDAECHQALRNLVSLTGAALFLGVLTEEDLALCDRGRTDLSQHSRPAAWYRRRLHRNLVNVGGGLYLKRPPSVTVWSLDALTAATP